MADEPLATVFPERKSQYVTIFLFLDLATLHRDAKFRGHSLRRTVHLVLAFALLGLGPTAATEVTQLSDATKREQDKPEGAI
jgi:hypothetical protein